MKESEMAKMQGDMVLQHIPTDIIDPSENNRLSDKGQVKPILSIKTDGIINPIYVQAIENGRYRVVAGERRRFSAVTFGIPTMPCFVCQDADQASVIKALENLDRKDLAPMDVAREIKVLLDKGKNAEDIASMLNISQWQFNRRVRLLNLHKTIIKMLDGQEITLATAEALATIDGKQKQLDVFEACKRNCWGKAVPNANDVMSHIKDMGVDLSACLPEFLGYISKKDGIHDCSTCIYNSASSCLFADGAKPVCDNKECYMKKLASWAESQNLSVFCSTWNGKDSVSRQLEKIRPDVVRTVDRSKRTVRTSKPSSGKYDTMVDEDGTFVWVEVPSDQDTAIQKDSADRLRKIRRAYSDAIKGINQTLQHIGKAVFEKLKVQYIRFFEEDMDEVGMLRMMLYILHNARSETMAQLCRIAYWDSGIRPIDFRSEYVGPMITPVFSSYYGNYGIDSIRQAIVGGKMPNDKEMEIYAMVQMISAVHASPLLALPASGKYPSPQTKNELVDYAVALGINVETSTGADLFDKYRKQVLEMELLQQKLGNPNFGGDTRTADAGSEVDENSEDSDYGCPTDEEIEGIVETA